MSNKQWIEGRSPWSRMKRIVNIYNAFTEEQGKRKKGEQKKRVKAKKVK
jgi:hypothetical protein